MTEYEIKRLENRIRELWNEKEDLLKEKEELENQNRLLGERCNQLLKDKGDLTDELAKWKEEWQEQVQKATDEGWERTKLTGRVRELENKIADIKANCDFAIEGRDVKIKELEDHLAEEVELHLHAEEYIKSLEQQIEKMKRHCNCKHRDSEGYCEVKRTYLMDLSYDGCDKWELED